MSLDCQGVWDTLVEVDSLQIINVVDNDTDGMSSTCASGGAFAFTSEFTSVTQAFLAGRLEEFDMRRTVHAGHGLSLLLLAKIGGVSRTLLLDGGPDSALWQMNAERLGLQADKLEAAVLSHWHPDHSVGLAAAAEWASAGRQAGAPPVVFDVHPDRPLRRGFQMPDGAKVPFNEDVTLKALQLPGCSVEQHREAHSLLGGSFFVSGQIPRLTEYEQGLPSHITQREWAGPPEGVEAAAGEVGSEEGGLWVRDPLLMDERYVAVKVKGRGPVVFSSCSHAGIVNVARHVSALSQASGGSPLLLGIVGGFHLSGRDCEPRVQRTVEDLAPLLDPESGVVLAGHCTGWRAKAALAQALPGHFQPLSVGGRYTFTGVE